MKAELESVTLQNRGVEITSQSEEERRVLMDIWTSDGKVVALRKNTDGQVTVSLAPVDLEEARDGRRPKR